VATAAVDDEDESGEWHRADGARYTLECIGGVAGLGSCSSMVDVDRERGGRGDDRRR